jgi:excisionase family DNA binding protein
LHFSGKHRRGVSATSESGIRSSEADSRGRKEIDQEKKTTMTARTDIQPSLATVNAGNHWMTAGEAADYLKVKPRSLTKWTRDGQLVGHPVSGTRRRMWRFRREELDAALLSRLVVSSQAPAVLTERKVM